MSWSMSQEGYSNLSLPISDWMSEMKSQSGLIASCAFMIASYMVSSSTSLAPASIITTFFLLPATVSSRSLFALCSAVGLMTILPSTKPTKTPAMGPFQGMLEMESAIDAPIIAEISGEQSGSTDITVRLMTTSLRRSFGKRGRMGLSITRDARIACSVGLPSRLFQEPGILPAA